MTKVTATQALESRKDIDRFARQYGAYISTSRQYRRRAPQPIMWDDDPRARYLDYYTQSQMLDEPYIEIHMPVESLERILHVTEVSEQDAAKVQHAMTVLKQHRVDEQVRNDNPAVQKAWRNYLMLLELARK